MKELILTVSTFGRCGGLERTVFLTVSTLGWCCGCERTDFLQFLLWEGVVVLIELIFNSFYFGIGVVFIRELIGLLCERPL